MMPADVARCQGGIYLSGNVMGCPVRDKCRRYLEPHPPGIVMTVYLMPNQNPCESFIEVEVDNSN